MEGVMMKNMEQYAVAVRKPNDEIEVMKGKYESLGNRYAICRGRSSGRDHLHRVFVHRHE